MVKSFSFFTQEDLSRGMGRREGNGTKRSSKGGKGIRCERQMKERNDMNEPLKRQERKCPRASNKEKGKEIKHFNFIAFTLFLCDHPHSSTFYLLYLIEDCEGEEKFTCQSQGEKGNGHK
jgi:hypothetical protein